MAITWADVVAIYPRAASVLAAGQTAILAAVDLQVNPTAWGQKVDLGKVALAAHLAQLGLNNGAGMVSSESVGQLSRSYFTPTWLKSSLGMTAWGLEYKRLLRLLPNALGAVP